MDSLKAGTILHGKSYDYKIVKTLGQGTFGITYLASVKMTGALGSIDSEILVAVKEFFMRDFNGRKESSVTYSSKDGAFAYYKSKFIHEADNLSKLHDDGIIKVIEQFEENQTAYYVMEYISGGSLDEYIKIKGHLSVKECISFAIQIADALSYMHQNKMLHLDLKPNNIMVKKDNNVVLIDFGLSKRFDAYGKPETSTTIGHGTPGYAPVEQANYQGNDNGEFPATMDVYALGGTMFKMLTGHRPPESSIILNDGFPFSELLDCGVPQSIVDIVAKCMDPLRKNRYKSTKDVIRALNSIDEGEDTTITSGRGCYKKGIGDRAYGTYEIINVPVTSSIKFPESIRIKVWDNSLTGKSYELYLTDNFPINGDISLQNSLTIWNQGQVEYDDSFHAGIPSDVKRYIIEHGFLSTEHWEKEEITSPIDDNFGTDVSILMTDSNGNSFSRRVQHAHRDWHSFLLEEILGMFNTTSLSTIIAQGQNNKQSQKHESFKIPSDTESISIRFKPCQIGGACNSVNGGYWYQFQSNHKKSNQNTVNIINLTPIIQDLNNLNLEIGNEIKDKHDYSENPGKLVIDIESRSAGVIRLFWVGFNNDMIAGNIYNANIIDLSSTIQNIIQKYLPKQHEPTRELIYSIPDSTSEIWIEYSEGGIVGLAKFLQLRLGESKKSPISSQFKYQYNREEFQQLLTGFRQLKLRSQDSVNIEPSTGITFPTLTISLFDKDGKKIKSFYAQDDGGNAIGNVAMKVDKLKNEIIKFSPSFANAIDNSIKESDKSKQSSWTEVIGLVIVASIVVCLIASPTYFFVTSTDDLFLWLWLSIGITELSVLLFGIFSLRDGTKMRDNISFGGFCLGALSLCAYVVLWIVQMCYWWV